MNDGFGLSAIRYEEHPAFASVPFNQDAQIEALTRELSGAIEMVRLWAKVPSTDVTHQLCKRVAPAADRLFAALKEQNRHIDVFADFADRLRHKLIELITEDVNVFAARGTHAYIDHSSRADTIAASLHEKGFWLDEFDSHAVQVLDEAVAPMKKLLWERHAKQNRIDRETLSINRWDDETALKLASVFDGPAIRTGISNYMGAPYCYSGCAFELSVPDTTWWSNRYGCADESAETAYYHLDQSSLYPKMICYLTDVTSDTGPTSVISLNLSQSTLSWVTGRALDGISVDPNRGNDTNMAKMLIGTAAGRLCFAALPKEMRCMGHFGNDILAGSQQERSIVNNRVVMIGPAGIFVVFDGSRAGHRGGIVKSGHRWAFQVIYAKKQ